MSLLDNAFTPCTLMERHRVPDGMGGYTSIWVEGPAFDAAIAEPMSTQEAIADKLGVTALYYVTTRRTLTLEYHDVFRRNSDGQVFRVTTDGTDNKTPRTAGLDMCQVKAELWELTE